MSTTQQKPVMFMSKGPNTRLVRWSGRELVVQGRVIQLPGKVYEFGDDSRLIVDERMVEQDAAFFAQHAAKYGSEHYPEYPEQDLLSWLRAKAQNDDKIFEVEPVTPSAEAELAALAQATIAKDAEAIQTILDAEEEGHNRKNVLRTAREALASLDSG